MLAKIIINWLNLKLSNRCKIITLIKKDVREKANLYLYLYGMV